jgi:hypothetical protein
VANATTRRQHPNAPLTPEGRRRMIGTGTPSINGSYAWV